MAKELEGKVAAVTGGASGIGTGQRRGDACRWGARGAGRPR
jgi:NAD(P)-dependent dehydrogenase (short-subunit alcohol dehydrogenase family)